MKDYSRKNYNDNQFRDWMRQHPAKAIWNPILEANPGQAEYSRHAKTSLQRAVADFIKQSELKKPWKNKGFPQMEDDWSGPKEGLKYDQPTSIQYPTAPSPVHVVFDADVVGGYCAGFQKTITINTTEKITGHHISFPSSGITVSIPTGGTSTEATITADAGFTGMVVIEIFMLADEVIVGPTSLPTDAAGHPTGASNINIFDAGSGCCDGITPMTYDDPNSPDNIGQSDDAIIYVLNGLAPFTWSVTGTGFSFISETTTDRNNLLETTSSACGSGEITVTDACGTEVEGVIVGTTGNWRSCSAHNFIQPNCGDSPCLSTVSPYYESLDVYGNHRIRVVICCDHPAYNDCADNFTWKCDSGAYHDDWQQTFNAESYPSGLNKLDCVYDELRFGYDFYGSQYLNVWIWAC